jgi:N-methylhydantoinase A
MSSSNGAASYVIGIDIGGTFTDCAVMVQPAGTLLCTKVPTTPHDPSEGFFAAIEAAARGLGFGTPQLLGMTARIVHGTTHGTNAIITRGGVKTGLITTAGHGDLLTLMKGSGRTIGLPPDVALHAPSTNKPEPIVPRWLVREVSERIDVDGDVVVPLDESSARAAIQALVEQDVAAIAVSLLWSIRNARHERSIAGWIAEMAPHVYVSTAHTLSSALGEYSRTMTAVMNAYIGPLMDEYIMRIEQGVRERGYAGSVQFAQCAGGAVTAAEAQAAPIRTVQSGPVSGVIGSSYVGRTLGTPNIISADMGGTTFDVSVIRDNQPLARDAALLERFELALPMVDVESVGAGGGSIAWVDELDRLQVGPRSAGAVPGPVCYGRGGTTPTVTDADVVLGVISPETFLHGKMRLDRDAAERAIRALGERLGLGVLETAAGINRIVDSRMADLIRRISVLRGFDPRDFVCLAFGGGGPVHAGAIMDQVGCQRTIVPLLNVASVWSAFGAATADFTHVYFRSAALDVPVPDGALDEVFEELENNARAELDAAGLDPARMIVRRTARIKYAAQVHGVDVPVRTSASGAYDPGRLSGDFDDIYALLYGEGAGYRQGGMQITGFHLRTVWPVDKPALETRSTDESPAVTSTRDVYWSEFGDIAETPVIRLAVDNVMGAVSGPALIELPDTVAVIRPRQRAWLDRLGNLVIERGEA